MQNKNGFGNAHLFVCFLNNALEFDSFDCCKGGGGTAGGLFFPLAVESTVDCFCAGGWGGGPRFVLRFASVALPDCSCCCFFCFLSVKCLVNSALKSKAGPLELKFEFVFVVSAGSLGGERFVGVVLAPEEKWWKRILVHEITIAILEVL